MTKNKKSNLDDTWEAIKKAAKETKQEIIIGTLSESKSVEVLKLIKSVVISDW